MRGEDLIRKERSRMFINVFSKVLGKTVSVDKDLEALDGEEARKKLLSMYFEVVKGIYLHFGD